jgi:hypothetical protein
VIEKDAAAMAWARDHVASQRIVAVHGDAAQETVAERAAELAQQAGTFTGWVNNAAVFRDAWLHEGGPVEVMGLITANLAPVLAGCAAAVRRFRAAYRWGDHQCIFPSGAAARSGSAALCDRQGCR